MWAGSPARKIEFRETLQADFGRPGLAQKSTVFPPVIPPLRGGSRQSQALGWDAMDAAVSCAPEIAGRALCFVGDQSSAQDDRR